MQKRNAELVRNLTPDFIRRGDPVIPSLSTNNVNNPPSDANLDSAFGTPANLPDPFFGIVDDNGLGTTVWLVVATNGSWFYTAMTLAT